MYRVVSTWSKWYENDMMIRELLSCIIHSSDALMQ